MLPHMVVIEDLQDPDYLYPSTSGLDKTSADPDVSILT